MNLAHKIRLITTPEQEAYFRKAAGTARFTWNWALAEYKKQNSEFGIYPKTNELRRYFNSIKYEIFPWLTEIARDPHFRAFDELNKAYSQFFSDIKRGKDVNEPIYKKKGKTKDSFYLANDVFHIEGISVKLPKIGKVKLAETPRFTGKITSGSVSRIANHWYLSINYELTQQEYSKHRTGNSVIGLDLGVTAAVITSDGKKYMSPKAHKRYLRRVSMRQRSYTRKRKHVIKEIGLEGKSIPKGTRIEPTKNMLKAQQKVAKTHERIANIRKDFTHKLTTQICKNHAEIVIEDLNVKGMLRNHRLARSISDIGFYEIRRQLTYKSSRYGCDLTVADMWYPSSKLCSKCGYKNINLSLSDRVWTCTACGTRHDRDINAARNLKSLAYLDNALPVANLVSNNQIILEDLHKTGRYGKVTSVSYDKATKDYRGRKERLHNPSDSRIKFYGTKNKVGGVTECM